MHVHWIQHNSAGNRANHKYSEDNININMESARVPSVSAHTVQDNSI